MRENFEQGGDPNHLIGYRVMRYDPETGRAISGADSRHGVRLQKGDIMEYGEGQFLTNNPQYAIDYYGQHDNNVLIKVEFDPSDLISGSLDDREPEISVKKSKILDWKPFIDPDLQESNMTKFEETYRQIMEDMVSGPGGAFGDLGGQEHGGALKSTDWYAPGDARVPKVIGAKEKKKKKKKAKGKKDEKSVPESKVDFSIQRRVFPNM